MKKIKEVPVVTEKVVEKVTSMQSSIVEEDGGLITLLGKVVNFHCCNYNYQGVLTGVNTSDIELTNAQVVFETGAYTSKEVKYGEKIPGKLFIRTSAIESYWLAP